MIIAAFLSHSLNLFSSRRHTLGSHYQIGFQVILFSRVVLFLKISFFILATKCACSSVSTVQLRRQKISISFRRRWWAIGWSSNPWSGGFERTRENQTTGLRSREMLHVPPGQGHPSRQLYGMVALDDLGHLCTAPAMEWVKCQLSRGLFITLWEKNHQGRNYFYPYLHWCLFSYPSLYEMSSSPCKV